MVEFNRDTFIKEYKVDLGERRKITREDVITTYKTLLNPSTEELMLYIDTPFCIKACKYCMFSPTETTSTSETYKDYYKYLKKQLEDYRELLESYTISEIYFGGGTPNFARVDELEMIKSLIPNFSGIKNKMMECNPVLMTEDKLNFLIDNNFTYISFGVQSLDKSVLKSQNRLPYDLKKLKYYISRLKEAGAVVNCDLLAFMQSGELTDLDTLSTDLETIWELGNDMLTFYPMFQRFNMAPDKDGKYVFGEDGDNNLQRLQRYRAVIYKHLRSNPQIELYRSSSKELVSLDSIRKSPLTDIILIKKGMSTPHTYNCSGYPHHVRHQSSMGFGGYGDKRVYGHIRRDFYYEISNKNGETLIEEIF